MLKLFVECFILKGASLYLIYPPLQESFAQKCFTLIDEYAPGFSTSVVGYDMLTPPDLEREIGLTGNKTILSV
jgi:phytoene dehydrogenase-like protein